MPSLHILLRRTGLGPPSFFNQVVSSEGALTSTVVCPFLVADGQGQEMMRVVEEWQKNMIELGDRKFTAWTALFFGVTNEGGQYSFTSINEYDPSYGKWRISDNEEVNWWAFHEGFRDAPER